MNQKYHRGDRVKVRYGHIIWTKTESNIGKYLGKAEFGFCYDTKPELSEDIATVEYVNGNENYRYMLKFEKYGSSSWFNEADLIPI